MSYEKNVERLKKAKKILENNIEKENDMIKNNKTYTGPNGKTYGPDHYKKAVKYDVAELKKVKSKLQLADGKNKQGWTTDPGGYARQSSDGYIAPTAKGIKKVEKARSMGIEHNYIDPTNSKKEGFNRNTKEIEKKKKKK